MCGTFTPLQSVDLLRVAVTARRLTAVKYYLAMLFLTANRTGLSGTAWQRKTNCFYGNQEKHYGEVRRDAFLSLQGIARGGSSPLADAT